MTVSTRVRAEERIVVGNIEGDLTPGQWLDGLRAVLDDPGYCLDFDEIWDLRACTSLLGCWEEVERFLGALALLRPEESPRRVALVVDNDDDLAMARILEEHARDLCKAFRSLDRAEDWIGHDAQIFPAC
ncbi:MAG: hypothetical protein R3F30_06380 [Planctomycetota bacterium]